MSFRKEDEDGDLGLSFGNIPIFGDPDRKNNSDLKRRWEQAPVVDVGHIWVTEVRKESPAVRCGGIKLRDELLSLNGQLMVGVDVAGARYALFSSLPSDICLNISYKIKVIKISGASAIKCILVHIFLDTKLGCVGFNRKNLVSLDCLK